MWRFSAIAIFVCSCTEPLAAAGLPDDAPAGTSSGGDESDGSTTDDTESSPDVGDETPAPEPVEELWRATSTEGRLDALCVRPDDDIVIAGARAGDRGGPAFVQRISADGEVGWRTELGSLGSTTIFHEVVCGPDGSIYAAGFADDLNHVIERYALPLLIKLDPDTGEPVGPTNAIVDPAVISREMPVSTGDPKR
jgi:hypothetical protein